LISKEGTFDFKRPVFFPAGYNCIGESNRCYGAAKELVWYFVEKQNTISFDQVFYG